MYNFYSSGITNIYKSDKDSQLHFIKVLSEYRYIDIDYIISIGCFFVPNNEYMVRYFGQGAYDSDKDMYNYYADTDEYICKWIGHLVIPLRNSIGEIVALTGFNPASKMLKEENLTKGTDHEVPPKYIYSNKKVFDRGRFIFCPRGIRKAMEENYIVIVDGLFDAITLASLGINSASMLGSIVNDMNIFPLSFIKNLYCAHDNDLAGERLYEVLKSKLGRVNSITQSKSKDIDKYITDYGSEKLVRIIKEQVNCGLTTSISLD